MKSSRQNIQVVCRFRPQNSLEESQGGEVCCEISPDNQSVSIIVRTNSICILTQQKNFAQASKAARYNFNYDHVFGLHDPQSKVYEKVGKPVVEGPLHEFKGIFF